MNPWGSDFSRFISEEILRMHHEEIMETCYRWHEAMWGVPCGPTLTMVHPTVIKGITTIADPTSVIMRTNRKES